MPTRAPTVAFDPGDPEPSWARAAACGSVAWAPGLDAWLVSDRAHVLEVLHAPAAFSSRDGLPAPPPPAGAGERYPWVTPSLVNADPPGHLAVRRVVNRAFTRGRMAALQPAADAAAEALVAGLRPRGAAELIADVGLPLAERVLLAAVGFPAAEAPVVRRWLEAFDATAADPAREDAAREHAAFAAHCRDRLAGPAPEGTVLAVLSAAGIPADVAVSALLQVLMAGVATTAQLLAHVTRLALATAWPDGDAALDALVRRAGVVRCAPRVATEDRTLGGARVRAGDRVLVRIASHDELAFGRGAHFCPGAPLARIEVAAGVRALGGLPNLHVAAEPPLERWPMLSLDALRALPLRWDVP